MAQTKKLLQIELNEFDPKFLRRQAEKLGLKNTLRFLDFDHSVTSTDDEVEHQGLDPWVQWVNVHSGLPSDKHGIKRLGDTTRQDYPQIWEQLAKTGKRWAAWGVMNAPMGDVKGCEVFMPDPWSFEEEAYPKSLNNLLSLPRYMARNYMEASRGEFIKRFMHFVRYYAPPTHWPILARFSLETVKATGTVGINLHSLTTLLDYLGALEFVRYRKRTSPEFSVIFLNHIAHLQHQFWPKGDDLHPEMKFGLEVNNLIMGLLLDSCDEDEAVIVLNGLKQENVAGDGFYVYRQINPETNFKTLLGMDNVDVEQLMTNDAHLRFETTKEADAAFARLSDIKLSDGHTLLFVEKLGDKHVFAQLSVEHEIDKDADVIVGNAAHKFFDLFDTVCERTGAHVPNGDAFAKGITLPDRFLNHEIYHEVVNYFNAPDALAPAA